MLYHYTSAKLLEKIIASGKLLPADEDGWGLLWATSAPTIDLTAFYAEEPLVARFTLHDCDFEPWTDVRSRYPRKKLLRAKRMERNTLKRYGMRHLDWYVRPTALPAGRWLRIDTRDQHWHPYVSNSWRKRGLWPQLGRMPWFNEWQYKHRGIDLGDDPNTMDDDALADHRYQTEETEETEEEED